MERDNVIYTLAAGLLVSCFLYCGVSSQNTTNSQVAQIKDREAEVGKMLNAARSNTDVYNSMIDVLKKDGYDVQVVQNLTTGKDEVIVTKISKN